MKYYQRALSQTMGIKAYSEGCKVPVSLKPNRNVHFSNDIVFQDYVREGELDRIGCFMRARRVSLDTIYHSGKSPTLKLPIWSGGERGAACSSKNVL